MCLGFLTCINDKPPEQVMAEQQQCSCEQTEYLNFYCLSHHRDFILIICHHRFLAGGLEPFLLCSNLESWDVLCRAGRYDLAFYILPLT